MKITPIFPVCKFLTPTPKSYNVLIEGKRKQQENKIQNKIKTKTKYRIYIKKKDEREKRKKKREKEGSIKPHRVLISPELYQELISLHNSIHGVSDTPHLQNLGTSKIVSISYH